MRAANHSGNPQDKIFLEEFKRESDALEKIMEKKPIQENLKHEEKEESDFIKMMENNKIPPIKKSPIIKPLKKKFGSFYPGINNISDYIAPLEVIPEKKSVDFEMNDEVVMKLLNMMNNQN